MLQGQISNPAMLRGSIDYNEVSSLIVKHSSLCILLALTANYELDQLHVKTAFLHDDLEEDIYLTQLFGFKVAGKES